MRLIANISLLFLELPLKERFAAAARHGFEGVEIQFPYEEDAKALRAAAGALPIELINLPAGAPDAGDVGLSTDAGRRNLFHAGIEQGLRMAETLGCSKVNVLCGAPPPGQAADVTQATLAENLRRAAERLAGSGIAVMVEPVNPFDVPGYWIDGLDKGLALLDRVAHDNLRLQFDLYHMARTEPDLVAAIARAGAHIGHVQFADTPGRHEPGTGTIDFAAARRVLEATGYAGAISAEYRPRGDTASGLGWMRAWRAAPPCRATH
jgi:hydroxypyruvate isomerase